MKLFRQWVCCIGGYKRQRTATEGESAKTPPSSPGAIASPSDAPQKPPRSRRKTAAASHECAVELVPAAEPPPTQAAVEVQRTQIDGGRGERITLHRAGAPDDRSGALTWRDVLDRWRSEPPFAAKFADALAAARYRDFFWEARPIVGRAGLAERFECVVLDAQGQLLRNGACSDDFAEHFDAAPTDPSAARVVAFDNLGRDARLVVPCPIAGVEAEVFGSLAPFLRRAAAESRAPQSADAGLAPGAVAAARDQLWARVAAEVLARLEERPSEALWVSTDGRGVPWLHVRLDQGPKYIKHQPYRAVHWAANGSRQEGDTALEERARQKRKQGGVDGPPPAKKKQQDRGDRARDRR